jgi:enoyl-CoA hydratase
VDLSELVMTVGAQRITAPVELEHSGEAGQIAVVSLSRPPVNAFDPELVAGLEVVVRALTADTNVRVVVFCGAGKVFSAGADVSALVELTRSPGGVDSAVEHVRRMQRLFDAVAAIPVPTVAALHGAAAGGGLELALACDVRVAGETARLGLPEVGIGLVPGAGGTQRITRLLGPGRGADMVLRAQLIDGTRAERIGLVQHLSTDTEVHNTALRVAEQIARGPRAALVAAKRCLTTTGGVPPRGLAAELNAVRQLLGTGETNDLLHAFNAARGRQERRELA